MAILLPDELVIVNSELMLVAPRDRETAQRNLDSNPTTMIQGGPLRSETMFSNKHSQSLHLEWRLLNHKW
jgi:hypothetical protein